MEEREQVKHVDLRAQKTDSAAGARPGVFQEPALADSAAKVFVDTRVVNFFLKVALQQKTDEEEEAARRARKEQVKAAKSSSRWAASRSANALFPRKEGPRS